MAAVEFELELTGLKFKFKGERNDIVGVRSGLEHQLSGLLAPAMATSVSKPHSMTAEIQASYEPVNGGGRKRPAKKANGVKEAPTAALDWQFNPEKWGGPKQAWNPTKKSLWLLLVLSEELGQKELSPGVIAATFNKHFREAGPIKSYNVSRDLRKVKNRLVAENTSVDPATWSLLQAGVVDAKKLVEEALSGNGTN